ncbi:helix-turn-helix transcriptional regulator [Streptomyces sp. C]|uniref:helix-turn-helix domain-containing protein n=1 Tax=Streptomyces sp. C TaxID=253839 RepID=UPI0001B572D2|nr:helix-turn-helix transcriptional regulator [Streptomyces sp. C]
MSGTGDERASLISARLDFLFAHIFPRDGGPQSQDAVSLATGVPVALLQRLRAGEPVTEGVDDDPFIARLEHLLKTRKTAEGKPHTITDVARACGKSRTWLYNLLDDKSKPSLESTKLLCKIFGVDPSFFTDGPLEALARHFGIEAGARFFVLPDDDELVRETKSQVELVALLREVGAPAVLSRYLGTLPPGAPPRSGA